MSCGKRKNFRCEREECNSDSSGKMKVVNFRLLTSSQIRSAVYNARNARVALLFEWCSDFLPALLLPWRSEKWRRRNKIRSRFYRWKRIRRRARLWQKTQDNNRWLETLPIFLSEVPICCSWAFDCFAVNVLGLCWFFQVLCDFSNVNLELCKFRIELDQW